MPLGVIPMFSLPLKKRALSLSIRARTSSVILPKLTEFISSKSFFTDTLYSAPPAAFVPAVTVVLSPATTVVCFLASASTSLIFSSAFLSCATFTASLSSVPAATDVIWRVTLFATSPTDTAELVAFHAAPVSVEAAPVLTS